MPTFVDVLLDAAELGFFVACAYAVLYAYARHRSAAWTARFRQRRLAVLAVLTLAMSAIKVIEDVLGKESGRLDEALLWLIRGQVPAALNGFFAGLTLSGSATALVSATAGAVVALLIFGHRFEAALIGASSITSALLVYVLKALIGRARPDLWQAQWSQWYWGSSFPSGHTLSTAAFATAAALCVARLYPRWATSAMVGALWWSCAVALSRLVLGAHWPTDVLAALCLGVLIPLLFSAAFEWYGRRPHTTEPS